jgi:hypothetical protein
MAVARTRASTSSRRTPALRCTTWPRNSRRYPEVQIAAKKERRGPSPGRPSPEPRSPGSAALSAVRQPGSALVPFQRRDGLQ